MKPTAQVERALALSEAGWNNCQISRELGVNRRTISDWVRGRTRFRRPLSSYMARLRIFLDRSYPLIIAECEAAMSIVLPASKVGVNRRKDESVYEVNSFSKHWPHLFPQHDPGVKHKRKIALESWQERIVERIRGGCCAA